MSAGRYRKKPVVIEAMQWDGTNGDALEGWGACLYRTDQVELWVEANQTWVPIEVGEWVVRDAAGFYPCKPAIFAATYEPVEADQ